jgi:hypothetical protein
MRLVDCEKRPPSPARNFEENELLSSNMAALTASAMNDLTLDVIEFFAGVDSLKNSQLPAIAVFSFADDKGINTILLITRLFRGI